MISKLKPETLLALTFAVCCNSIGLISFADTAPASNNTLNGNVHKTTVKASQATWGQRHPKMKAAAIDGGIGAAAGGATGLLTHRGVVKGAAIGGAAGAGVGVARKTAIAKRHPIVTDAGTGVAAGAALGLISGRRHMTAEGALIGGAAGLGVGLWKNRKNL